MNASPLRLLRQLGPWLATALPVILPAAEPAEPKTHVLFMGADIDVQLDKQEYRVKNVAGSTFVVTKNGKAVEVSTNRGPVGLKVTPSLKLSAGGAKVDGLKIERAYTPENDPNKKWAAAQGGGAAQAAISMTGGRMANAMQGATQGSLITSRAMGGPGQGNAGAVPTGAEAQAIAAFDQAVRGAGSDLNSAGYAAQKLQEDLEKQLFDAVRVNCDISAPQPVRDPYIVVVTQYREKDDPTGPVRSWVQGYQLERLDQNPIKVRILQGGLPPGYELLKQQLHVYGGGRELGTNVAEKNVALTRDEAHQFIVLDHLATHKGATLAPSLAFGIERNDLASHFAGEQLARQIFVKVDKDGLPQGAFRDEACAQPSGDESLEKLVAQTRFKPALETGKTVDGVVRLKLADLAP